MTSKYKKFECIILGYIVMMMAVFLVLAVPLDCFGDKTSLADDSGGAVIQTIPCQLEIESGLVATAYSDDQTTTKVTRYVLGSAKRGVDKSQVTFWIANEGSESLFVKPQIRESQCVSATFNPSQAAIAVGQRTRFTMTASYSSSCPIGQLDYEIQIIQMSP